MRGSVLFGFEADVEATPRLHVVICLPSDVSNVSSLSSARSLSACRTPASRSQPGSRTRNSSPPRAQADLQFIGVERLGDVVVGARFHALDKIFSLTLGRKEKNVDVRGTASLAHLAANLDAIHLRHHPVENGQPRRVLLLQF